MQNHKICLIGYGYWGKILHKNLSALGHQDIMIFDKVLDNLDKINDSFDYYFVATPFTTHEETLLSLSKFKGKKIWCEKPLASSLGSVNQIYELLESNGNHLFVDWIYLFNPAIDFIKKKIKGKRIKQAILNRTNDGPVRTDCTSIWDLSSHDISIVLKLFGDKNYNFNWNEFSIKNHENMGSNVSWTYFQGTQIIINSSWQHSKKNRVSVFITDDDQTIVFDDIKKMVTLSDGEVYDFSCERSPMESALQYFFESDEFSENKKITQRITAHLTNQNIKNGGNKI